MEVNQHDAKRELGPEGEASHHHHRSAMMHARTQREQLRECNSVCPSATHKIKTQYNAPNRERDDVGQGRPKCQPQGVHALGNAQVAKPLQEQHQDEKSGQGERVQIAEKATHGMGETGTNSSEARQTSRGITHSSAS